MPTTPAPATKRSRPPPKPWRSWRSATARASPAPAGHVLGSAQVVVRWKGITVVVTGDYKRRRDPTCPPFEPVPCDVFVTEATFGLPVFRHPDDAGEVRKVLRSIEQFPRSEEHTS